MTELITAQPVSWPRSPYDEIIREESTCIWSLIDQKDKLVVIIERLVAKFNAVVQLSFCCVRVNSIYFA